MDLSASIIIEKDSDGNLQKKIKSNLDGSIIVIDKGKNIKDLSKKERDSIEEQDNLHNYNNLVNRAGSATGIYTVAFGVINVVRLVLFL
jgi:hypothetical protein